MEVQRGHDGVHEGPGEEQDAPGLHVGEGPWVWTSGRRVHEGVVRVCNALRNNSLRVSTYNQTKKKLRIKKVITL